jgi:hypothetical protein
MASFAPATASRRRSTSDPVSRSNRVRTASMAISAARSPPGWPPTPSTTMKMPRATST